MKDVPARPKGTLFPKEVSFISEILCTFADGFVN